MSDQRIVSYTLSASDAEQVNRRRRDAANFPNPQSGAVVHTGNEARPGDVRPMIIVQVWAVGLVNGQVFLDGNDTLWVTSVKEGEGLGTWSRPAK